MAAPAGKVLLFHSDAVADDTLLVHQMEGQESISRPYRFEVDLVSSEASLDYDKLLSQAVFLGIKQGVPIKGSPRRGFRTRKIHGMLASFEQLEKRLDWVRYRAVLVPRLWKLSLTSQSRIFIDKTVPEIVEEVLKGAGFSSPNDYELKVTGRKYAKQEYVVQYQESDLDFLSRWLEHEGIFYFFDQTEVADKLVIADSTSGYVPIQGEASIAYKPTSGLATRTEVPDAEEADDWFRVEVVHELFFKQSVIPRQVLIKDYNWRKPTLDLKCEAEVLKGGVGVVYEYGNHYKDTSEGKELARVRAEEIRCRQKLFTGVSDCKVFQAGATYGLVEHYRSDWNAKYLITEVKHHATQAVGLATSGSTGPTYRNEFTSIPADAVFRPERSSPWPSIHGIMNATIDASGSGEYPEIDDMGRYKVKLPFDLSDKKDGKASRYVRMMQPYAGGGMGMHFPLHKGTEVALVFVDGDPDRPIIAGAIPNPDTASPVAGGNQSQCALHTSGGNKMVIENQAGKQSMTMSSPAGNTVFSMGIG